MKALLTIAALALSAAAHAQVDAPKPVETPTEHRIRLALIGTVAAGRMGDLITTERCNAVAGCHEGMLPQSWASSPASMTAFEAGSVVLETFASNHLAKRHPKLAIVADAASAASIWFTVGRNAALQSGRPAVGVFHRF